MAARPYPPLTLSAITAATGICRVAYNPRGANTYEFNQISAEMAGASAATCAIRRNGALVCPIVATGDAAGGDPPVWIWPGDELTVEWTGAPVGAVGKVTAFYNLHSAEA
jgi:hypothetical protein